jgi:hypothetical protein
MLGLLFDLLLILTGAVLVKAWPPADRVATRVRDWLADKLAKLRP